MGTPPETTMGGSARAFPSTRWSLLLLAGDPASPAHAEAMAAFCRIYWKPVYAYLRALRSYDNEQAKDLTQEFLLHVVEGGLLERYSRERGNFRSYLKGALRFFASKDRRDATIQRRGGGRKAVPLDDADVLRVGDLVDRLGVTAEEIFDRQWADALLDQSVTELRDALVRSGRGVVFDVFDRHDINPPPGGKASYGDVAAALGIKETDVTNHLFTCRRMLREILFANIREFVADDEEAKQELHRLLLP